jgi:hypothetical protein
MSIEVIQSNGKTYEPSVADIEVACKYPVTELIRYFATIRLLLQAGFCLLITVGCATQHDLAGLKLSLRSTDELIVLKQSETVGMLTEQTNALAAIRATLKVIEDSETDSGREVINLDNEQQPDTTANDSQPPQHQADASAAVRLLVSSTAGCAPCARLWRDVDAGLFDGFAVEKSGDFDGLKSYPAIRYQDADSATGWAVVYGYDAAQLRLLKKLLPKTAAYRTAFWTHDEMVAKHNQLHGGGSWTWPGDLARHLATVHGVETNGMDKSDASRTVTGKQYAVRSVSRGIFGRFRSRNSYRKSCPAGGCP